MGRPGAVHKATGLLLLLLLQQLLLGPADGLRAPPSAKGRRGATRLRVKDASLDSLSPPGGSGPAPQGAGANPLRVRRNPKTTKTFARFLEIEALLEPRVEPLRPTLLSLAKACKSISELVRNAAGYDLDGMFEESAGQATVNVQGEDVKKLDVVTNRMLKATVCAGGGVSCVASEEEDEPQLCAFVMDNENAAFSGDYAVVFDPLDGSANIDQGLSAGTIFGVYQVPEHAKRGDWKAALLQPGSQLLAAGYCLYGSSTTLVLTTGRGVNAFSLDEVSGDFILRHENIKMPRSGAYFSFNEGNYADWHAPVQDFVDGLKTGEGRLQRRYSGRYQGALAADVHTILLRGGIFGYPGTVSKPAGKLRLLYEAIPMSFLIEQAGGVGSDGHGRILHRMPAEIHERVPFFIGSADEVGELERCLRQPGDSDGA